MINGPLTHVVVTCDGQEVSLYLNGEKEGTESASAEWSFEFTGPTADPLVEIGRLSIEWHKAPNAAAMRRARKAWERAVEEKAS